MRSVVSHRCLLDLRFYTVLDSECLQEMYYVYKRLM